MEKAAGAQLPLVRESQKETGKPSIYIGATNALKAAGLSADGFAMWEHAIAVKGADILSIGLRYVRRSLGEGGSRPCEG